MQRLGRVLLVGPLLLVAQHHPLPWWLLETGPSHVSQPPSGVPRATDLETPWSVKSQWRPAGAKLSLSCHVVSATWLFLLKFSYLLHCWERPPGLILEPLKMAEATWGKFLGKFPDPLYTGCWLEPLFILALALPTAGQGLERAGSRGMRTPADTVAHALGPQHPRLHP